MGRAGCKGDYKSAKTRTERRFKLSQMPTDTSSTASGPPPSQREMSAVLTEGVSERVYYLDSKLRSACRLADVKSPLPL